MKRAKISIIGAGNVGAATAHWCAVKELGDIVLLDIPQTGDMPKGKGLDLFESGPIIRFDSRVEGTTDYAQTAGSDIVIVTAGLPRKPGMTRDDLLATNAKIVGEVARHVAKTSPDAIAIIISNPLDAMAQYFMEITGFPRERVIGQAGVLDTGRFSTFIADELGVSPKDVSTMLLGGHGDTMVPLASCASVGGIPVTQLISPKRLEEIILRARNGGAEIVGLLKTGGAYYAPGAAVAVMVESIIRDQNRLLPCSVYCGEEYQVGGYFIGVPVVLGDGGIKKIIPLQMDESEQKMFRESVDAVRNLVDAMHKLMISESQERGA